MKCFLARGINGYILFGLQGSLDYDKENDWTICKLSTVVSTF